MPISRVVLKEPRDPRMTRRTSAVASRKKRIRWATIAQNKGEPEKDAGRRRCRPAKDEGRRWRANEYDGGGGGGANIVSHCRKWKAKGAHADDSDHVKVQGGRSGGEARLRRTLTITSAIGDDARYVWRKHRQRRRPMDGRPMTIKEAAMAAATRDDDVDDEVRRKAQGGVARCSSHSHHMCSAAPALQLRPCFVCSPARSSSFGRDSICALGSRLRAIGADSGRRSWCGGGNRDHESVHQIDPRRACGDRSRRSRRVGARQVVAASLPQIFH